MTAPAHPSMSATATLTNCYVPLPAVSSTSNNSSSSAADYDPYARPNKEHDTSSLHPSHSQNTTTTSSTRGPRTLRQLHLAKSILSESTGSALVELGHTKVIVSVRGPRPIHCSSMSNNNSTSGNSILQCQVRYMSHVGIRMETLANHSLANDFSSSNTSGGGGGHEFHVIQ